MTAVTISTAAAHLMVCRQRSLLAGLSYPTIGRPQARLQSERPVSAILATIIGEEGGIEVAGGGTGQSQAPCPCLTAAITPWDAASGKEGDR